LDLGGFFSKDTLNSSVVLFSIQPCQSLLYIVGPSESTCGFSRKNEKVDEFLSGCPPAGPPQASAIFIIVNQRQAENELVCRRDE